jgi:exodeoxyribonuclease V alpha subunit
MNNTTQYAAKFDDTGKLTLIPVSELYMDICGKVFYTNSKNPKIFKIHAEQLNREIRCYCEFYCPLQEGDAIFGKCKFDQYTQYGEQLTFTTAPFVQIAEDKESILKCFLRALRGHHFGNKSAYELFDRLMEKNGSLDASLKLLDRLACHWTSHGDEDIFIPYSTVLTDGQMKVLSGWWYKNRVLRRLELLGFNSKDVQQINIPPNEIYLKILDNPYTVPEISLSRCDEILERMNKPINPEARQCGEMIRKIYAFMNERGWSGIPSNIFMSLYPESPKMIELLKKDYGVKADLHTVYLSYPHEVETNVVKIIQKMLSSGIMEYEILPDSIVYTRNNLSPDQKNAIEGSLTQNLSIINGPAGSGKTTVIREIVHNLEQRGISYRVVSFTGKAVSRLKEVLNKKTPSTMHKMIADKKDKKKFSHLIIDEISQVSTSLFYEFKKKFDFDYKITMIGDMNQLTPIGWGSLFDQLIKSQLIPTYSLTQNHRTFTSKDNGIIINANAIISYDDDENAPPFDFVVTKNFNMFPGDVKVIEQLLGGLRNAGIVADQIVIICPYNKSLSELNQMCQRIFNGDNRSVTDEYGTTWRLKDRIMMKQNNYEINIMNREEGTIIDLTDNEIKVAFRDGTSHIFQLRTQVLNLPTTTGSLELPTVEKKGPLLTSKMIEHAYAITVDCAQGTEWQYVIYYIPDGSKTSSFLNKNRLYTAITRAKTAIWCVGDLMAMAYSATKNPPYRCEKLALRLKNSQTIVFNDPNIPII